MKIDRRDLKWRARDAVRAARPNARLMTLIYLLLTSGLSVVVGLFAADPFGRIFGLYQQGMPPERAIPLAIAGVGTAGLFANVLMAIFGLVLDFGRVVNDLDLTGNPIHLGIVPAKQINKRKYKLDVVHTPQNDVLYILRQFMGRRHMVEVAPVGIQLHTTEDAGGHACSLPA